MGTWEETQLPVGNDGFFRVRIGRTQGTVNRDILVLRIPEVIDALRVRVIDQ